MQHTEKHGREHRRAPYGAFARIVRLPVLRGGPVWVRPTAVRFRWPCHRRVRLHGEAQPGGRAVTASIVAARATDPAASTPAAIARRAPTSMLATRIATADAFGSVHPVRQRHFCLAGPAAAAVTATRAP